MPVAPVVTNLMIVPSTVMVSPFWNPTASESLGAVPDNFVLAVIGAGGAA